MKRLLLILILTFSFQTLSKADDIRDFEIEGMSIGDSLLDYISFEKISNNISNGLNYKGTNYQRTCINDYGSVYDRVCITFLNDKKKFIQAMQGQLRYKNLNYKLCKNRMDNIDKELSNLFKDLIKKNWGLLEMTLFKETYPESTYHPITFDFQDKSRAQLACYNYPSTDTTVFKMAIYNADIRTLVTSKAVTK